MNQAKEDVNKEFQRVGKASGSKDPQNYEEDPGATHPPKGKRGGAKGFQKPKHVKQIERYMKQEIERGLQEVEESYLNRTEVATLQNKHLKAGVK